MSLPSRRGFLAATAAALAGSRLLGADSPLVSMTKSVGVTDIFAEVAASPLSTLFLTWQRDPTTTMTIQWIGPADLDPIDTAISYCEDVPREIWVTQSPMVRAYPHTYLAIYRTEITGLSPDTMYQFRVGKNAGPFKFRTMPSKATDAIHFISGGDCGTNTHAVNNNIQAARQDPMFAIIGGDVAYENGNSADTHLTFVRNYSKTMIGREGRLIPLIACMGNHEVDGGYGKPHTAPFFFALFDGLYPDTSYATLDFGDYLSLVLLDTGHNSLIPGEQTCWLDQTLRNRVDHPHVFVVNHVPAYPSFRNMESVPGGKPGEQPKGGTGAGNRKYWTPLFDKYRVPVVLEHHDHTFKRTHPLIDGMVNDDGVLYLGDGSWGQIRAPQSPDKLSFLARASRDYHLSLHSIQGSERFHLALDEFGRVMDVGHSGQRKLGLVAVPA